MISTQVTATVVEVGWLMLEHVGRSAAVRRALETGVVLRVARAVHETQRERGLISTYVASDGRARALELGRQFLRTDAAMDLAVRGSVMNQRLALSMRRRWLLDNNALCHAGRCCAQTRRHLQAAGHRHGPVAEADCGEARGRGGPRRA